MINSVSVIIPAYKPDEKMINTLNELVSAGFTDLLVVDDGSGEEYHELFRQVSSIPQCTLLRHSVNRGKGAALKTAMAFFMDNRPDQAGVVTADADGQHLTEDIISASKAMLETNTVVLGCRDFSQPDVPSSNRMGNRITIGVFRLFFGMKIGDTQTGLRAFPRDTLPIIMTAKGDRYEFETYMLFLMNQHKMSHNEVKISTVYIEENKSSHFRIVRDSIRIYALILKYLLSSVASSIIDEGVFFLLKLLFGGLTAVLFIPTTFIAAALARVISSIFNYLVNAKVVFEGQTGKSTLIKYYILAAAQIIISTCIVYMFEHIFCVQSALLITLIKIIVDTVLFFFSFRIQHRWVFRKDPPHTDF